MSKSASEIRFGKLPSYIYSGATGYDSSKLGLGPLMVQISGITNDDNWTGPLPISVVRPMEYSTPTALAYPWAMQWSNNQDWVFAIDNGSAAAFRRIYKMTYHRDDGDFGIDGFIHVTFPTTTNFTVRGFRMTYDLYTTGTVAAQLTNVTGYGTEFLSGICSGNRIGFGSTVPSEINQWYTISGTVTNSLLRLQNPITGSIVSGTPYVIEDLRAVIAATNATAANGGLFIVKGLSSDFFTPGGQVIRSTGTVDNLQATYHLIDNNTVLNTTACGLALEPKIDNFTQYAYVLDGTTNPFLFKYNIRAPLAGLAAGRSITPFILKTAQPGVLAGTASQANNGRLANAGHGPGEGIDCLYFTTTTRLYRTIALNSIASGASNWIADNSVETPPGGTTTFGASSLMNSIEYASAIDKFIICVNATTTPFRSYVTKFLTDGSAYDRVFGCDIRQIDQSTADSTTTLLPSMGGAPYSVWSEGGVVYIATLGATAILNRIYAAPMGADWEYAASTKCRIITPEILTPSCSKFLRVYINRMEVLGGSTNLNLGLPPEPFKVYYRTAGISDDSGGWTLLDDYADMSGVAAAPSIQLMFEFRTIGVLMIPARLLSATVLYEDTATLSNYQPSVGNSSVSNKQFAWRFATAFGGTVPTLRVRLFDAVTNGLLVDDNTSSPVGTFEKSTDGGSSWGAYNTADKTNETTYIRYTPASLGDNIRVAALLTLL